MPIFRLGEQLVFPPVHLSENDGFLAVGGSLNPERLLLAYASGIFPWGEHQGEITWWAPNPRCILDTNEFKVSKSLKQVIRSNKFRVTFDQAFEEVLNHCATAGTRAFEGTWLSDRLQWVFSELHEMGHAHSVEVWEGDELVGGLYGVELGQYFSGESMFHLRSNASKVAFYHLVEFLKTRNNLLLDCQLSTDHLLSMGAKDVTRTKYMDLLDKSIHVQAKATKWAEKSSPALDRV